MAVATRAHRDDGSSAAFAGNWHEHGLDADEGVVPGDSGRPERNQGGGATTLYGGVAAKWRGGKGGGRTGTRDGVRITRLEAH